MQNKRTRQPWHPAAPQMQPLEIDVREFQRRVNPVKFEYAARMLENPTLTEAILDKRMRHSRLRNWTFHRQVVALGYILDFFFPAVGLCVEIDGKYHDRKARKALDEQRDKALEAYGIKTIRFTDEQVFASPPIVVKAIRIEVFSMATLIWAGLDKKNIGR